MRGGLCSFVLALALSACAATNGPSSAAGRIHFGPALTLHLCVLKSVSLSAKRATAYLDDVRGDLSSYRIPVDVAWIHPWEQPGGGSAGTLADLRQRPLEAPCDRLVALVDRTGAAFISGLLLPEVSGQADRATSTHGYIVLAYSAPNPLFHRAQIASIEAFHALLGCTAEMGTNECEHRIAELKAAADPDSGFFPGITADGGYLTSRAAANEALLRADARTP